MKTLVNYNLGPAGTPQDIKDLRKSAYDFHNELGAPVVFKHRWNAKDAADGLTRVCPLHDELYAGRDSEWDTICFGTGYVGGYSDGEIIFVTLQDSQETQIKIGPEGTLFADMHPALEAPWLPHMGDGDLIIAIEFDPNDWTITEEQERFTLRDVSPITIRGPGWGRQRSPVLTRQRISQKSMLDKLPIGHPLYGVPIVFDYSNVPDDPTPPYVPDPPSPGELQYTETSYLARVHGIEDDTPEPINEGETSYIERTGRITGTSADHGTHIVF